MECDFCSDPNVVRQYECMDFSAESKTAGVLRDDGPKGRTNIILDSRNFWAACESCSRYVDDEDIDGLIGHVAATFRSRGSKVSAQFLQYTRHIYEEFFRNRIRIECE